MRAVVERALEEDAPHGDVTSEVTIPAATQASAALVAREAGVMACAAVLPIVFESCKVISHLDDGSTFEQGSVLAEISGPARAVLRGERVALNLLQRMCGIATLTKAYVDAIGDAHARVVDTRKTTPGLRALEKHAVVCGGGRNHRFSLSDAVLVKDNHIAVADAAGIDLSTMLRSVRDSIPHTMQIEVEVDRLDQIEPVLSSGVVDTIMLDNFSIEELREGVRMVDRRASIEASGGITLATIREVAETGVDVISVGALTHAARSLDLGLDIVTR